MPKTAAVDGPPVGKLATTVSASALALHLDCSRTYIGKLEAEGVIQRQADGFPLDQSRVAYLRYLRRERQQSPRSRPTPTTSRSRPRCCRLRLMEKRRELVLQSDVDELTDQLCGVVLTHLSSLPARCAPRGDLAVRRNIERVVFEVRTEIAKVCQRWPTSAASRRLMNRADYGNRS